MSEYNTMTHEELVQAVFKLLRRLPPEEQQRIMDKFEKNGEEARA